MCNPEQNKETADFVAAARRLGSGFNGPGGSGSGGSLMGSTSRAIQGATAKFAQKPTSVVKATPQNKTPSAMPQPSLPAENGQSFASNSPSLPSFSPVKQAQPTGNGSEKIVKS